MENLKSEDSSKQLTPSKKLEQLHNLAFENPIILDRIFSYFGKVNDLKNFRLVSRLWRETSLKQWRRFGTLRLLWKKDAYLPCRHCQYSTSPDQNRAEDYYREALSIQEYLQMLRISQRKGESCPYQLWNKPFSRYTIGYCSLPNQHQLQDRHLGTFLAVCGAQIKYIKLDHLIMDRAMYFEAIGWILSKLSNLEELGVQLQPAQTQLPSNIQDRWEGFHDNLASLACKAASKLESVHLGFCKDVEYETIRDSSQNLYKLLRFLPNIKNLTGDSKAFLYLQVLRTPNIHQQFIQLKSLILPFQECNNLYSYNILSKYITDAKPPLETLKMGVSLYRSSNFLQELLRSCQHTIQHLELRSEMSLTLKGMSLGGHLGRIEFPQLTKLYLYSEAVISFTALKGVPHLETLWIETLNRRYNWNDRVTADATDERSGGRLLWRGMTHLHLDYNRFTPDSLRVMRRWMPNLRRVELILHRSTRELAFKIWPDVEELVGSEADHTYYRY